jgi:hypothetical protein
MKLVVGLLLAACLLLSSVEVFAGDEEGGCDGKCRPAMKRIMRKVRKIFKEKDRNGDGVIGPREWGPRVRIFKAIDRNQDGKITPREMAAFLLKRLKKRRDDKPE